MKLSLKIHSGRKFQRGFTLAEIMVAMGIFLLMITAVLSSHIFGLKMYEIARVKLGASDKARKAISFFSDEVKKAKIVEIGNVTAGTFLKINPDLPIKGNAIQIYATEDLTQFVRYFRDTDQSLKRMTDHGVPTVVAGSVTNEIIFTKENENGDVLASDTGKFVVGMTLEFKDLDFTGSSSHSGNMYDYYKLETKITPRN